jgi:hypothetical protein
LAVVAVVLGLVVAALAYADVRVREIAEAEAEKQLRIAVPTAREADVEIDAFPFVGWVLVDGSVRRLRVTLEDLEASGIEIERLELDAEGVILDRDRLLDDQVLVVTDVKRVRVSGSITEQVVGKALEIPLDLEPGKATVTVRGRKLTASLSVNGHSAVLSVGGMPPMVVPLPPDAYLPCDPDVTIEKDRLVATCTTSELPPAVMKVLREGVG